MLNRRIALLLCLTLVLSVPSALADAMDRYVGTWAAKDVVVDIRREKDDIKCNAVFKAGDDLYDIWEYSFLWYDKAEKRLNCGGISKTRKQHDPKTDQMIEQDWSLSDLYFAQFEVSLEGSVLYWTDDGLDRPIELSKLTGDNARKWHEALTTGRYAPD